MKIVFLEPPANFLPIRHGFYCPNQAILALAAYLEQYKYRVDIIDSFILRLNWRGILKQLEVKNPDVVCISGYTYKTYYCMAMAELIKIYFPKVITIAGGMHFSALPEESLRICKAIDYIIIGEGEETLLELVKTLEERKVRKSLVDIKGIAFMEDGNFIQTTSRPFIEDIDLLPMPAYHLLLTKNQKILFTWRNTIGCIFSRGCRYQCGFCSSTTHWRQTVRRRSTEVIVDEIELLAKKYNKNRIVFYDDDFLSNMSKNEEFLEQIEKRNLRIKYVIRTRVDEIIRNKHLLKRFKNSGLISVSLGVESFQQEYLSNWKKNYKLEQFTSAVQFLRKEKIPLIEVYLIFGSPTDNKESFTYMIRKLKENKLSIFFVSFLTPLPKTETYSKMYSKIEVWDYRKYDFTHPLIPTNYLSRLEMKTMISKFTFFWWLSPIRLINCIGNIDRIKFYLFRLYMHLRAFYNLLRFFISGNKKDEYNLHIEEIHNRHLQYIGKEETKEEFSLFGKRWGFED